MVSKATAPHDIFLKRISWSDDPDMLSFLQSINVGDITNLATEIVFDKLNDLKLLNDLSKRSSILRTIVPLTVNTTVSVMRIMLSDVLSKMMLKHIVEAASTRDITKAAMNNIYNLLVSKEEQLYSANINVALMLLVNEVVYAGVFAPGLTTLELVVDEDLSSNVFVFKKMDEQAFGKREMYEIEKDCVRRGATYSENEEPFKLPLGRKKRAEEG